MFHPDFQFGTPTGGDLLAELGVDRHTVREIVEDERSIRCPGPGRGVSRIRLREPRPGSAVRPRAARGGAGGALPGYVVPSGRTEVEEGLRRVNGRGWGE